MFRKMIIVLLCLKVIWLQAQIALENGFPIRQGNHIEWSRSAISAEDGTVILIWSDTRYGDRDVFVEKVDWGGVPLWGNVGLDLYRGFNRQEDPVGVTDGKSGAIVSWVDFEQDSTGDIRAARISTTGEVLWVKNVCLFPGKQTSIRMCDDGSGGAFISWLDYRATTDGDIYISYVDSSGNIPPGWGESGIPVCNVTGVQSSHTIDKDGAGGAFIAWSDWRDENNPQVFIQRYTSDGIARFEPNGRPVMAGIGEEENPKITYTSGGVCLVWRDNRDDSFFDLYVQKFDTSGVELWDSTGVAVCTYDGEQRNPRIVTDSKGGCVISWEDFRNNPYYPDIYIQRVDSTGNPSWTLDGVPVCTSDRAQLESRLLNRGDTFYVIWMDERNGGYPYQDIYAQAVSLNGEVLWELNGVVVCNADFYQFSPLFRRTSNGVMAIWGDMRDGSVDLRIQHYAPFGGIELEENGLLLLPGIDGDARHIQVLSGQDQDNSSVVYLVWEDDRRGFSGSRIYTQKLETGRFPGWEKNGIPVSLKEGVSQSEPVATIEDNGFFCAYIEDESGMKRIMAQRITSSGLRSWGHDGFLVKEVIEPVNLLAASLGDNNYVLAWSDYNADWYYQVYLQRLNSSPQILWGETGVGIGEEGSDVYVEDLAVIGDTILVLWRGGSWGDQNLQATLLTADSQLLVDKITLCDESGNQLHARVKSDGRLFWVMWEDYRSGSSDLYLQVLTSSGVALLPENGQPVCNAENGQLNFDLEPGFVDDYNQLTVTWQDFRNGEDYNIYTQIVTLQPPFAANNTVMVMKYEGGLAITSHPSNQTKPVCLRQGPIIWEDLRNGITSDLYFYFNQISNDVQPLCLAENKQLNPQVVNLFSGDTMLDSALVVWEDKRSSGKTELKNIYARKLYRGTVYNSIENQSQGFPERFEIQGLYPNPFNDSFTIQYRNPEVKRVELLIFDITGRLLSSSELNLKGEGRYRVNIERLTGRPISSGIYILRFKTDKMDISRKILYLK